MPLSIQLPTAAPLPPPPQQKQQRAAKKSGRGAVLRAVASAANLASAGSLPAATVQDVGALLYPLGRARELRPRHVDDETGVVMMRLANGVGLSYKRTTFEPAFCYVQVSAGGARMRLAPAISAAHLLPHRPSLRQLVAHGGRLMEDAGTHAGLDVGLDTLLHSGAGGACLLYAAASHRFAAATASATHACLVPPLPPLPAHRPDTLARLLDLWGIGVSQYVGEEEVTVTLSFSTRETGLLRALQLLHLWVSQPQWVRACHRPPARPSVRERA